MWSPNIQSSLGKNIEEVLLDEKERYKYWNVFTSTRQKLITKRSGLKSMCSKS